MFIHVAREQFIGGTSDFMAMPALSNASSCPKQPKQKWELMRSGGELVQSMDVALLQKQQ